MTVDRDRAEKILTELRSRPGLYYELLRQMEDASEVLQPWEPLPDGTAWVRRRMREPRFLHGDQDNVVAQVKGSVNHFFAGVREPGRDWFSDVETGEISDYGSPRHCFPTLDAALAAADAELEAGGYLLPPARWDAVVGPWGRPRGHKWGSLTLQRVGRGCRGVASVFLDRPGPGEPPYRAMVDGVQVGGMCHSEREAMDVCDRRLRELGYALEGGP